MSAYELPGEVVERLRQLMDPADAHQVLWFFERTAGVMEPGTFFKALVPAIVAADMRNQARLSMGFPGLVAAVQIAQGHHNGIHVLQEAAGIDGCPTCHGIGAVRNPEARGDGESILMTCPTCRGRGTATRPEQVMPPS